MKQSDGKKENSPTVCAKKVEKITAPKKAAKSRLNIALAVVCACVFCAGIIVMLIVLSGTARLGVTNKTNLLAFNGSYSVDGGAEIPLTDKTKIDAGNKKTVTFTGSFSRAVAQTEQIIFRSENLIFSLSVNGQKVFSFGQEGGEAPPSAFSKSPGNCWAVWDCGSISPFDEIEITVQNVYSDVNRNQFNNFYKGIYAGSVGELYQIMYDRNFFSYVFGAGLLFLGIAMLIVSIALFCFERKVTLRYLWLSFAALTSGIWCYIDFDYISLFVPYPVFVNMADIFSLVFMCVFLLLYVKSHLKKRATNALLAAGTFGLCAFIAVGLVLQLCGICDLHELTYILMLLLFFMGASILGCTAYEAVQLKSKDTLLLAANIVPLFLFGMLQVLFSFLGLNQKGNFLRVGILLFCLFAFTFLFFKILQTIKKVEHAYQTEITLSQREKELLQSKISLMLGQIQPHFLFNSLTAVGQLCAVNPALAEKAVHNFADYLRGNVDALGQESMIPFSRELEHVRVYIELEKMRFEQRVNAEFDLQVTDFMVPTLTVQTLVENAVNHGITKKKKGGTVKISTREESGYIVISVADDGVGFDTTSNKEDGKSHIGLKNVSLRLAATCGGTLEIKSEPGQGAEMVVRIPKSSL